MVHGIATSKSLEKRSPDTGVTRPAVNVRICRDPCSTVADHLADGCRASPDGGHRLTLSLCRVGLRWIKAAPSARGPGCGRRWGADLAGAQQQDAFPVHAIPTATSRVLASDRRLAPSPWWLDRTATTTHIKSACGVPTGSASRLLTCAALAWVWQLSGGRGENRWPVFQCS
jgi:hypothetical protein